LAEVTRRRLAPFRAAQLGGKDRLAASHAEHGAIVAAICAGDGAAAAAAMRAHLAATEGSLGVMSGGEARL
jgi:DNA-binding FadR family transcriptional regulator